MDERKKENNSQEKGAIANPMPEEVYNTYPPSKRQERAEVRSRPSDQTFLKKKKTAP